MDQVGGTNFIKKLFGIGSKDRARRKDEQAARDDALERLMDMEITGDPKVDKARIDTAMSPVYGGPGFADLNNIQDPRDEHTQKLMKRVNSYFAGQPFPNAPDADLRPGASMDSEDSNPDPRADAALLPGASMDSEDSNPDPRADAALLPGASMDSEDSNPDPRADAALLPGASMDSEESDAVLGLRRKLKNAHKRVLSCLMEVVDPNTITKRDRALIERFWHAIGTNEAVAIYNMLSADGKALMDKHGLMDHESGSAWMSRDRGVLEPIDEETEWTAHGGGRYVASAALALVVLVSAVAQSFA